MTIAEKQELSASVLRERVVAFASQLQAWGYDAAASEMLTEILGSGVHAPDYDRLRDALHQIAQWALDAYPVDMFPEQDLKRADAVLDEAGISLSAIHGSWARHLTQGIGEIARNALQG